MPRKRKIESLGLQSMVLPIFKFEGGDHVMKAKKVMAVCGSSFLQLWGSYGEVEGYGPTDVIMPRAVLGRDGSFEITLK